MFHAFHKSSALKDIVERYRRPAYDQPSEVQPLQWLGDLRGTPVALAPETPHSEGGLLRIISFLVQLLLFIKSSRPELVTLLQQMSPIGFALEDQVDCQKNIL